MCIKKVLLIRHGETKGNLEKRYIGSRTDESLSEEGLNKLKARDRKGLVIYSSPMKRCLETVKAVFGEDRPGVRDNLKEIDFGDFEGKNYQELNGNPDYQRWIDSGGTMPFPNGESRENFIERSYKDFMNILMEEDSEQFAIVCHGGNIMSIMSRLTGKDYYDFQVKCGEGYEVTVSLKDNGDIDEISYNRIFNGSDS